MHWIFCRREDVYQCLVYGVFESVVVIIFESVFNLKIY
jgi:hypothetical protein